MSVIAWVCLSLSSLERNSSCVLNSRCVNFYITYHYCLFLHILFYVFSMLSDDINKFYNVMTLSLVRWHDSILESIVSYSRRKYLLLIMLSISCRNYLKQPLIWNILFYFTPKTVLILDVGSIGHSI